MTKPQAVLRRKDTTSRSALYIAFDLGDKNWQISLGDDRFQVRGYTVAAGDTAAVAARILKAAERLRISGRSEVYGVYEAGRDGWCSIDGCASWAWTTSSLMRPASRSIVGHDEPRPIGSTPTNCWRC